MKNIDKVRQMTPKELIAFMKKLNCHKCSYNGTNCQHEMCTEGMVKWLEQEGELTAIEVNKEYSQFCRQTSCCDCYNHEGCYFAFIADKFNIIDGKITRR